MTQISNGLIPSFSVETQEYKKTTEDSYVNDGGENRFDRILNKTINEENEFSERKDNNSAEKISSTAAKSNKKISDTKVCEKKEELAQDKPLI